MLISGADINPILQSALLSARRSVRLMMYTLSPSGQASHAQFIRTWQAIEAAGKKGIDCRAIVCSWADNNPQHLAQQRAAARLQAAGYAVRFAKRGTIFHHKSWLIDSRAAIIGSHNLTEAGFLRTENTSIMSCDPIDTAELEALFAVAWAAAHDPNPTEAR